MTKQILPTNSTDRLLMVADRIEYESAHWNQAEFFLVRGADANIETIRSFGGTGDELLLKCGTTACIAGWGMALTPRDQITEWFDYDVQGAKSLGFTHQLGEHIFYTMKAWDFFPEVLRRLAKVEVGDGHGYRTVNHLRKVLADMDITETHPFHPDFDHN